MTEIFNVDYVWHSVTVNCAHNSEPVELVKVRYYIHYSVPPMCLQCSAHEEAYPHFMSILQLSPSVLRAL